VLALLSACWSERAAIPPPRGRDAPAIERAGERPARRVRSRKDLEGWMLPLPAHGLLTALFGVTGEQRVVVDLDAKTLTAGRDLVDLSDPLRPAPPPVTIPLADADLDRLWRLAEETWRSPPPRAREVTDYREVVIAADGDQIMLVSVQGPMAQGEPAHRLARALRAAAGWP
jgi:hypothetical protein